MTGPAVIVQLVDGEFVHSDAEAWRHETEARHLLRLPLEQRRADLVAIEEKRGAAAADALKVTMAALHRVARGEAA